MVTNLYNTFILTKSISLIIMKKFALLIVLLSFSFASAQDSASNGLNDISFDNEFTDRSTNDADLEALEFTTDTKFGNITFKAPSKIDVINIYDENQQQIFSAKGSIIVGDTMSISFLENGKYYVEVVVGEAIGSQQISI